MRKIIHLADLHFDRTDQKIVQALIATVRDLTPDLVIVSGDLTQRAKPAQFKAAKDFLYKLPSPQLVVPGNHDIPLYNIWRRFVNPLKRFLEFINRNTEETYIDEEIAVIGLNTARSLVFKGGRVSLKQAARVRQIITSLGDKSKEIVIILVSHHPINRIRSWRTSYFGHADYILGVFINLGVDLFLAGHLHKSNTISIVRRVKERDHAALFVQAGTAVSVRYRDEFNSFNLITVDGPRITVTPYLWQQEYSKFTAVAQKSYDRTEDGWLVETPSS